MNQKKKLLTIFVIIFWDLLSFGMIIPLIPILGYELGQGGLKVGLLISSYSFVRLFSAPFFANLSDTWGRKVILCMGLFGSSVAYLFFAFSDTFLELLFSRMLAGFFGGNVAIAGAYIADITSPKERSRNMGLIGLSFGLGFSLGPALGFLILMLVGEKFGVFPPFGMHFVALCASCFNLFNGFLCCFVLRESLQKKSLKTNANTKHFSHFSKNNWRKKLKRKYGSCFVGLTSHLYKMGQAFYTPMLGPILIMAFLLYFALAHTEPVLILFLQDHFFWGSSMAYGAFSYIGFLMILSHGYLVRTWIARWGEGFVSKLGLLKMSLGLFFIGLSGFFFVQKEDMLFSIPFLLLFFGVTLLSIGYSLAYTSLNGALSLTVSRQRQGYFFGVQQSVFSLARITAPGIAGFLYQYTFYPIPFFIAGIIGFFALILGYRIQNHFPNTGKGGSDLGKRT